MPDRTPTSDAGDDPTRGDATREALLRAAVDRFGRDGYHAVSNRALGEAAGVNAALIGYHFGGKRGLYLAAFERIAEEMGRRVGPVAAEVERELASLEERSDAEHRERLVGCVLRLVDGYAAMLTAPESAPWARLIVREQQDPSDALRILYDGVLGRTADLVSRLVHRIRGGDEEEARLTALTLFGQAVVFRVARATVLWQLGWDEIGPREAERIRRRIRRNTRAILSADGDSDTEGDRP